MTNETETTDKSAMFKVDILITFLRIMSFALCVIAGAAVSISFSIHALVERFAP